MIIFQIVIVAVASAAVFCSHHVNTYPVVDIEPLPMPPHVQMPNLPTEKTLALVQQAQIAIQDRLRIFEPRIYKKDVSLTRNTPAWFMSISRTSRPTARNLTNIALIAEEATKYINQV